MKKISAILALIATANISMAQLAWIEPEPTLANEPITIYVDLSKLDLSLEHNQKLFENAGPMYIWTWRPAEHPIGHPLVNGEGEKAWQNSNEALKMTAVPEKGPKVWKYEMTPTEFYGVSASDVYTKGLSFLVKPKNGGGFGDPDIKSNDINLPVNPPKTDKGAVYLFPSVLLSDEIMTLTYDNAAEKKVTMRNLNPGEELYIFVKATAIDTTTQLVTIYQPSTFFQVPNNPKLRLENVSATQWKLYMIPRTFFNIPSTQTLQDIEFIVRKKNWSSDDDSSADKPKVEAGCN